MKKTFLIILFAAAMQQILAQPLKFGLRAGLNESQAVFGQPNISSSSVAGFNAGVFSEIKWGSWSFEPGIFFSTAGYNSSYSGSSNYILPEIYGASSTVKLRYLQIPVNVLYNIPTRPFNIFIGAGPYVGFALSGTTEGSSYENSYSTTYPQSPIHFGAPDSFKRLDFGLSCIGGLSLKEGYFFSAGYNFGLSNIAESPGISVKNMVWNVSLGYEFL